MADTVEKEKMEEILSDDIEIGSDIVNDKLETEIRTLIIILNLEMLLNVAEVYEIASREKERKCWFLVGPAEEVEKQQLRQALPLISKSHQ